MKNPIVRPLLILFLSSLPYSLLKSQDLSSTSETQSSSASLGAKDHYLKALEYEKNNKVDEALNEYAKAISVDESYLPAYLRRAMILRFYITDAIADVDTAEELLDNGWLSSDGTTEKDLRTEISFIRGNIYFDNKDYTKSIYNYAQASSLDPQNLDISYRLAEAYFFNEDFDNAIIILKEILDSDNAYRSRCWLTLGKIYEKQENYTVAFTCYKMSITRDSLNYLAYWNRGAMKEKLGDFIGAMDDYDNVIRINPTAVNLYIDRAHLKFKLKKFSEAKYDVEKVLEFDNQSIAGLKSKALYYFHIKDRPNEILAYSEILRNYPNETNIYLKRGLAKLSIKRDGCPDLRKAGELGSMGAFKLIKQYCNR